MIIDLKTHPMYNAVVVSQALEILEEKGMTVDKLKDMREAQLLLGLDDLASHAWYDTLDHAIDIMTKPLSK